MQKIFFRRFAIEAGCQKTERLICPRVKEFAELFSKSDFPSEDHSQGVKVPPCLQNGERLAAAPRADESFSPSLFSKSDSPKAK